MKLDPRTKLLILTLTSLVVFFVQITLIECLLVLFPFLLLMGFKKYNVAIKYGVFYVVLLFLGLWLAPILPMGIGSIVLVFGTYIRKLIPSFMLATLLISTTKVSEFLAAIGRLHLPKGLTIALSITLRYFPTMSEEWRYIKDAMELRGISTTLGGFLRHPTKSMEYIYVPMLTSATKIADEITQAAITRGIEYTAKRTCVTDITFTIYDVVVLFCYLGLILFSAWIMGGVV
ncbi:MAG: energy-coupling factor transporter transmembrane component T [Bacillota bacterium]